MNRAILSRGAFAVFYGRNLKYFIKNPEVFSATTFRSSPPFGQVQPLVFSCYS
jgi:hypothetical protein